MDIESKLASDISKYRKPGNTSTPLVWAKAELVKALIFLVSIILAVSIPAIFLSKQAGLCPNGGPERQNVDRYGCTCNCWDGMLKGCYGSKSSYGSDFHHVMFNLTRETYWLALLTAFYFVLMTNAIKYFIGIVLGYFLPTNDGSKAETASVCLLTLVAFLSTFFPNIYGWWMWFNYLNDEFDRFVSTQLFFSVTELISTVLLYNFLDEDTSNRIPASLRRDLYLLPTTISAAHLTISWANFSSNVSNGNSSLIIRDIFLLGTDVVVISACMIKWMKLGGVAKSSPLTFGNVASSVDSRSKQMFIISGCVYCTMLIWFYYGIASSY